MTDTNYGWLALTQKDIFGVIRNYLNLSWDELRHDFVFYATNL